MSADISDDGSNKINVIIVGGGLSGLTAAAHILDKEPGLTVRIIEATDRLGGQLMQTELGELGGRWVSDDQYHILALWNRLQLPPMRKHINWNEELHLHMKRCWDLDRGLFAPLARFELKRYMSALDLLAPLFRPGNYNPRKRSVTMDEDIRSRLVFSQSIEFMRCLVLLVCGVDARSISFQQFMNILYSCNSLTNVIDIYLRCPTNLLEISSTDLILALEARCKDAEILLGRRVQAVHQYSEHVVVVDASLEFHKAEIVILAVPWNNIEDIRFRPRVPDLLWDQDMPVVPHRQYVTSFIATYPDSHWRNAGYSGHFMSTKPPSFLIGYEYRPSVFAGMVYHEEGMDPLIRQVALERLAQFFGPGMLTPIAYEEHTFWANSLVNYPFTAVWRRIVWASSGTSGTSYRGFIGGAVQTGWRAAVNTLLILRPQHVSWQDIADFQIGAGKTLWTQRKRSLAITRLLSRINIYHLAVISFLSISGTWLIIKTMRSCQS